MPTRQSTVNPQIYTDSNRCLSDRQGDSDKQPEDTKLSSHERKAIEIQGRKKAIMHLFKTSANQKNVNQSKLKSLVSMCGKKLIKIAKQ